MQGQAGFPFFLFGLFPGRNDQDIIDPELMEILLPVVDPVNILCLFHRDSSFPDIYAGITGPDPEVGNDAFHIPADLVAGLLRAVDQDGASFCFFHIKTQDCRPVVLPGLGQDVHEHLLLLRGCQGYIILDLGSIHTDIHHGADQDILRFTSGSDSEPHPFHMSVLYFQESPLPAAERSCYTHNVPAACRTL